MPILHAPILEQAGFVKSLIQPVINYVARLDGGRYWQLSEPVNLIDDFEVEVDVIPNEDLTRSQTILGSSSYDGGIYININTGDLVWKIENSAGGSAFLVVSGDGLFTGFPVRLRAARVGDTFSLYINNSIVGQTSSVGAKALNIDYLGRRLAGNYFDGIIYNVKFKNGSDEVINEITLTNKPQGATQLPTVGNISATMIGYSDDVWEVAPSDIVLPNQFVADFSSAGWSGSQSDIQALNTLTDELMEVPTVKSAYDNGTLLLAPMVGNSSADKLKCVFHPSQGAGYEMPTLISNISETGVKGDDVNFVDTGYDGAGLDWHSITTLVHGRYFRNVRSDKNQYLVYGKETTVNGDTSVFHSSFSTKIRSGSTFNFTNGAYCESDGFQSGTFASVCLGTGSDKQRAWRNTVLASATTEAGSYGRLSQGTNTFKLLANDSGGNASTAEIQTFMMCDGIPDNEYPAVQAAIEKFNRYRSTYNESEKSNGTFELWIFAGQSNSVGNQVLNNVPQNVSGFELDENNHNAYSWLRDNSGFEDLHMPADFELGSGVVNIGAYMAMFNTMLESNPNRRLALVPTAVGATGFSSGDWNVGDTVYENHLAMINAAVSAGGVIKGMVWVQGEGDVSMTHQEYVDAYNAMFNNMKSRIVGGWPADAKVILGQLANPTWYNNARYEQIALENDNTIYVTQADAGVDQLSDAERWDEADKVHYSSIAQRLLGVKYAEIADQ